jgi:hypothetical protein
MLQYKKDIEILYSIWRPIQFLRILFYFIYLLYFGIDTSALRTLCLLGRLSWWCVREVDLRFVCFGAVLA